MHDSIKYKLIKGLLLLFGLLGLLLLYYNCRINGLEGTFIDFVVPILIVIIGIVFADAMNGDIN